MVVRKLFTMKCQMAMLFTMVVGGFVLARHLLPNFSCANSSSVRALYPESIIDKIGKVFLPLLKNNETKDLQKAIETLYPESIRDKIGKLFLPLLTKNETKDLEKPMEILYQESITDKIGKLFLPLLTNNETKGLQKAMAAFKNVNEFNVTYFMFAGTLLGSYRHHGIIPWDKDIDILVKSGDRNVLLTYLESKKPEFDLFWKSGDVWRFSHKDAFRSESGDRWPYMDIFFYEEDATHVWATFELEKDFKYDKTDVFPLIERPFMGLMLPAPRNTLAVLSKKKFDVKRCQSNIYAFNDVIPDPAKPVVEIPCDFLKDRIPLVNREHSFNETHTYETLEVLNNSTSYITSQTYLLPK